MKILIDSQEQDIWVKRFEAEGFEVEKVKLPIGDFYLPEKNIIIERKTISDFCTSIISGHLQKQLQQQELNFDNSYLLLEGCWKDFARFSKTKFKNKNYITGFIAHLRKYPKTIVIPCEFPTYVPLLIKKLYEKSEDSTGDIFDTELLRNQITSEHLSYRLLTCFDRVGIKRAKKFLEDKEIKDATENFIKLMEDKKVKK